ncbi:hypothetical protein H9Q72_009373 [Fusarium xylarioides]|uniref:Zn(2)-C6 fungal-type domain-containing protein n=1 Tax=Fusarium xylarioides TaxID=221167 RepID=A0A9P7HSN7_9HYPO|nr:hypothetical protein H9Q72_009373 [Fusarium xylarioides]
MVITAPEQYIPTESKRVLACVLCQQRKKKCDRNSPCSSCIKAKVLCIPSTSAPKRKPRKPTKELLARLERCEELLKRSTCVQKSLMYESLESHSGSSSPINTTSSPPPDYEKMSTASEELQHQH